MQNIIPQLKNANALDDYKLFVEFDDGISGIIDLSKWKNKPLFSLWNVKDNFKNFKITENKKIEWDEEIDMDPDHFTSS
jgi:hypothetical protein